MQLNVMTSDDHKEHPCISISTDDSGKVFIINVTRTAYGMQIIHLKIAKIDFFTLYEIIKKCCCDNIIKKKRFIQNIGI